MFARLLRIQTKIERIDEAAKLFKESVIPLCKNQKGYKGAYFLTDRKTGISIPMTLWESEEDMLATESSHFFPGTTCQVHDFLQSTSHSRSF